jgi:SAM-dependent methyltransferase
MPKLPSLNSDANHDGQGRRARRLPSLPLRNRERMLEYRLRNPVSIATYGSVAFVILGATYILTLHSPPAWLPKPIQELFVRLSGMVAAWLPQIGTTTTHFVNAVSFAGFVFTAFGLVYTILQLRLIESRIEDYPGFYFWAQRAFDEFSAGTSKELLIMGSTSLPGNIAHGIKRSNHIVDFQRGLLHSISSRLFESSSSEVPPIRLLLPHLDDYELTYGLYKNTRIAGVMDKSEQQEWEHKIDVGMKDASTFHSGLRDWQSAAAFFASFGIPILAADKKLVSASTVAYIPGTWPVTIRSVDSTSPIFHALTHGYLICTDARATYAMPIHYTKAQGDEATPYVVPQLVGFTTSNGAVVRAMRQLFEDVWDEAGNDVARAQLHRFYDRHLKDHEVANWWKQAKDRLSQNEDPAVLVNELDSLDHDHFLGHQATLQCIEHLGGIGRGSRVLDLGGGFGGPARSIAKTLHADVTVVDVRDQRVRTGTEMFLELRGAGHWSSMWGDVRFVSRDLETLDWAELVRDGAFDGVISLLAILHCGEKRRILRKLPTTLRTGGHFFITDFIKGTGFNRTSAQGLRDIGCPGLLSQEEYLANLSRGGALVKGLRIKTVEWSEEADARLLRFNDPATHDSLVLKYGDGRVAEAKALYETVCHLFSARVIEGIEIWGVRA